MNVLDFLQQSDLRHLRFGFYKLVYVRPTQLCPASCRHCSARSGPETGRTASLEQLECWMPSIVSIPGLEWIGVEGGEPFAALPQLKFILQAARDHGLSTSVLTNAFWAKNERTAGIVLEKLPRINFLIVSADEFHEEFIPLKRVITALDAARGYVDRLAVQICMGPHYPDFIDRFYQQAGKDLVGNIEIIEAPLQYVGRAQETGIMKHPDTIHELPEGSCLFLGTPVLREDGLFSACCQQDVVLSKQRSIFHLGNLEENRASELRAGVDADVYFQTLRVFGPKAIAEAAITYHWGWEPHPYQAGNICDLCLHLAGNQQVVEGFRETFSTPVYRKKLALGRSILFSEPLNASC